jgi:isoleucyl-tRNA synthetase
VDDLTNWYVRRSRRRFWKSEQDGDKNNAYATLYYLLVRLSRLLAPFTPFLSEAIYQNLVRCARSEAHESVHHTRWPQVNPAVVDENLLAQMALAREVASLGLGARNNANIKVRQPLGRAMAYVTSGAGRLIPELVEIVTDELNVKSFEFVSEAGKLVNYHLMPDNKLLGPRFGAQFPKVRTALMNADPASVAAAVQSGQSLMLQVDGQPVELSPAEVLVQTTPVAGLAVASDHGVTVAVDATLTPELRAEGLAREMVRRVQDMRKKAGFNIEDRIRVYYQLNAEGVLQGVMATWGAYIGTETLAVELSAGQPPEGAYSEEHQVEGETITLAVKQV